VTCYAAQHLHPKDWGLLEVCLRITHGGKHPLYFDGRKMAARFSGVSKTCIYDSAARLVTAGWLLPLNGTGRKIAQATKRYEATQYEVLTHDKWVAVHGAQGCSNPFPIPGMDSSAGVTPVSRSCNSIPEINELQSGNCTNPVPSSGHSFLGISLLKPPVAKSFAHEDRIAELEQQLQDLPQYRPARPDCEKCGGSGLVQRVHYGMPRLVPCKCRCTSQPVGSDQKTEKPAVSMGASA
jgi:hypothetical protein